MPSLKCLGCLQEISEKAISLSTNDFNIKQKLISQINHQISKEFNHIKLPDFSTKIFKIIAQESGNNNPFLQIKIESNNAVKSIIPIIENKLEELSESEILKNLVLYSIASNMIDFSTGGHSVNLNQIVKNILDFPKEGLHIDNFKRFFTHVKKAKIIIYLADNCGEIVIDNLMIKYLVKHFNKKVYLGLKESPIANDCSIEDFKRDRLEEYATDVFPINSSFGWNLHESTDRFKKLLKSSDLLIAKGQSNYETTLNNLVRYPKNIYPIIYCILRTKCEVVTKHLGVPLGSNVLKQMYPSNKNKRVLITEITNCK